MADCWGSSRSPCRPMLSVGGSFVESLHQTCGRRCTTRRSRRRNSFRNPHAPDDRHTGRQTASIRLQFNLQVCLHRSLAPQRRRSAQARRGEGVPGVWRGGIVSRWIHGHHISAERQIDRQPSNEATRFGLARSLGPYPRYLWGRWRRVSRWW